MGGEAQPTETLHRERGLTGCGTQDAQIQSTEGNTGVGGRWEALRQRRPAKLRTGQTDTDNLKEGSAACFSLIFEAQH